MVTDKRGKRIETGEFLWRLAHAFNIFNEENRKIKDSIPSH